jgi:hypothetical protein
MITVRQIDRLWTAKAYDRLLEQLISPRPEASDRLISQLNGQLSAGSMAIIRLDELSQSFVPLYGQLLRTILKAQRPDGGWCDVPTTAICLKALLCGNGDGATIYRGMSFLAALQKEEGIWPSMPVRRMPIDPFASAFVLFCLSDSAVFNQTIQSEAAIEWFESNKLAMDSITNRLWSHAKTRLCSRIRKQTSVATSVYGDRFWDLQKSITSSKSIATATS